MSERKVFIFSREEREAALAEVRRGASFREVARKIGACHSTVADWAAAAGITPHERVRRGPIESYRLTEQERRVLLEQTSARTGMNYSQIMRRGLRLVAMQTWAKSNDLPPER